MKQTLIIEAGLVGAGSLALYWFFAMCLAKLLPLWALFFMTGFAKHYLGYLLKLHNEYCACDVEERANIVRDSLLEGCLFVVCGWMLVLITKVDPFLAAFFTGFLLHIVFDALGIHRAYCGAYCKK